MIHVHRSLALLSRLFSSKLFQTYAQMFDWTYGVPLFLAVGTGGKVSNPDKRSAFCLSVNPGDCCCSRCPFGKFPPLAGLEPWVWSASCAAGLQVTMAPVRCGARCHGWLISGHHAVGDVPPVAEVAEMGQRAGVLLTRGQLEKYREVPIITEGVHRESKRYLELAGEIIGSEINSMLVADSDRESAWIRAIKGYLRSLRSVEMDPLEEELEERFFADVGFTPIEFLQRTKVEAARREIMAGAGSAKEIVSAARGYGCEDLSRFLGLFEKFFAETPQEHHRRMKRVQHDLWMHPIRPADHR